jgi:hypothetical protein
MSTCPQCDKKLLETELKSVMDFLANKRTELYCSTQFPCVYCKAPLTFEKDLGSYYLFYTEENKIFIGAA